MISADGARESVGVSRCPEFAFKRECRMQKRSDVRQRPGLASMLRDFKGSLHEPIHST